MDVSTDLKTRMLARLEPPCGRAWQRFSIAWTPKRRGVATLASRATSVNDDSQPTSGQRNAIYCVTVNVD
jgi:hypothetical protein